MTAFIEATTRPCGMSEAGSAVRSGGDAGVVADKVICAGRDVHSRQLGIRRKADAVVFGEGGKDVQISSSCEISRVEPADVDHAALVGSNGRHETLPFGGVVYAYRRAESKSAGSG